MPHIFGVIMRTQALLFSLALCQVATAQVQQPPIKIAVSVIDQPKMTETVHIPIYRMAGLSLPTVDLTKAAVLWDVFPEGKADFRELSDGSALMTGPPGLYTVKGLIVTIVDGKPVLQRTSISVQIGGTPPPPTPPAPADLSSSIREAFIKEPADQRPLLTTLADFYDAALVVVDDPTSTGWTELFKAMKALAGVKGVSGKLAYVQAAIAPYLQGQLQNKAFNKDLAKTTFAEIAKAIRAVPASANKWHSTTYRKAK